MTTELDKVLKKLPAKRRKKIRREADKKLREYRTLRELRNRLGLTQTQVADRQGVRQVNISNLEHRCDMLLSTLKNYIEALDCELQIVITTPDKKRVVLQDLP